MGATDNKKISMGNLLNNNSKKEKINIWKARI